MVDPTDEGVSVSPDCYINFWLRKEGYQILISGIIWSHLYVKKKKERYKWTYLENRNRLTDMKNKLMVAKGEGVGGRDRWVWGE